MSQHILNPLPGSSGSTVSKAPVKTLSSSGDGYLLDTTSLVPASGVALSETSPYKNEAPYLQYSPEMMSMLFQRICPPESHGKNTPSSNEKMDAPEGKNPFPPVEKTGGVATEKSTPVNYGIFGSSESVLNDRRPLTKFEEGFSKTLPIEDMPWKSRQSPHANIMNGESPEDITILSQAIRSENSHTSKAIRKFWAKVNTDLSCLDGALGCVGSIPSDNEWVKERTRALFESVYEAIESFQQDIFKATELDTKEFVDAESEVEFDGMDAEPVVIGRGESLERWARWVGRSEADIVVLQKAPFGSDIEKIEACGTEALRDSGVDIYLLADLLKENDIGKVRKYIRETSKMRGVDFVFRRPKEVRNATGRQLTSREEATIAGSSIGYITLEGFFATLAYVFAKSSKMNE